MRAGITTLYRYCIDNKLQTLLSEYSEDNPYPADKIGFKSTTVCKWVCSHGHIEYEAPYNRVRRGYCKTCDHDCAGSLGQRYPELAKYWAPENEKSAFAISPRSAVPHYWCCEHGHKWKRTIAQQLHRPAPTARARKIPCLPTDRSFWTNGTTNAIISLRKASVI